MICIFKNSILLFSISGKHLTAFFDSTYSKNEVYLFFFRYPFGAVATLQNTISARPRGDNVTEYLHVFFFVFLLLFISDPEFCFFGLKI